ncbi:uncharacterized protein LOC120072003 [Benincasa hispida]|uniref:uncharacterized protein LOC120072003 n=1 Tax=Benincasa hispida TaxID=102211 RepID=UPI0019025E52|nr:uncharacterized protein LOC120072003 [Benincasa hispida]
MPSYVKFLKDVLTKKRKINELEAITLMQEWNALINRNILEKQKHPGCFTVPCSIGGINVENVLCDLGASINLMPLSILKKLGIDFIILDYEVDWDVPIILGCPFLATRKALIDVNKEELAMRVNNQEVKFNVFNALRFPNDVE